MISALPSGSAPANVNRRQLRRDLHAQHGRRSLEFGGALGSAEATIPRRSTLPGLSRIARPPGTGKKGFNPLERRLSRRNDEMALFIGAVADLEGVPDQMALARSDRQNPEIVLGDAPIVPRPGVALEIGIPRQRVRSAAGVGPGDQALVPVILVDRRPLIYALDGDRRAAGDGVEERALVEDVVGRQGGERDRPSRWDRPNDVQEPSQGRGGPLIDLLVEFVTRTQTVVSLSGDRIADTRGAAVLGGFATQMSGLVHQFGLP